MQREFRRSVPGANVRFVDSEEGDGRRIRARVLTYNVVDDYGTVFAPGVFNRSLTERLPKIVHSHDWTKPIGRWVGWEEDERGLVLDGELDDPEYVPLAGEVAYQLRVGTLDQFSVGFVRTAERDGSDEFGPGVWVITEGILDETSPVLVGAVPDTELLSIRQAPRGIGLTVRSPAGLVVPIETAQRIVLQMESGELDLADGLQALKQAAQPDVENGAGEADKSGDGGASSDGTSDSGAAGPPESEDSGEGSSAGDPPRDPDTGDRPEDDDDLDDAALLDDLDEALAIVGKGS